MALILNAPQGRMDGALRQWRAWRGWMALILNAPQGGWMALLLVNPRTA
jgi:hypothetical protein